MIAFVKGKVDCVNINSVIVECGGLGYEVFVSANTLSKLGLNQEVKLYTYFQAKEDAIGLFGFLSKEEHNMFNMLISVSGVGPKSAINILGSTTPQNLMLAIISNDITAMSKLPGIGKKTAGRLILELKDKIKTEEATSFDFGGTKDFSVSDDTPKSDAVQALTALGYSRSDALKAVVNIYEDGMDAQQIIKLGLKKLNN